MFTWLRWIQRISARRSSNCCCVLPAYPKKIQCTWVACAWIWNALIRAVFWLFKIVSSETLLSCVFTKEARRREKGYIRLSPKVQYSISTLSFTFSWYYFFSIPQKQLRSRWSIFYSVDNICYVAVFSCVFPPFVCAISTYLVLPSRPLDPIIFNSLLPSCQLFWVVIIFFLLSFLIVASS